MLRAAFDRSVAWGRNKAYPWLANVAFPKGRGVLLRWWDDVDAHPGSHGVTAALTLLCFGLAKLFWALYR